MEIVANLEELRVRISNSIQAKHRRIDCNKIGELLLFVVAAVSAARVDVFINLRFFLAIFGENR